jgi:hypothetical protein
VFAHGYAVHATGAAIVSKVDARVLRIASCPRAKRISVTVTRGSRRSGSCHLPPPTR